MQEDVAVIYPLSLGLFYQFSGPGLSLSITQKSSVVSLPYNGPARSPLAERLRLENYG